MKQTQKYQCSGCTRTRTITLDPFRTNCKVFPEEAGPCICSAEARYLPVDPKPFIPPKESYVVGQK